MRWAGPYSLTEHGQQRNCRYYSSYTAKNLCYQYAGMKFCEEVDAGIHWHILHPYEPVQAGPYTVTPFPAKHMTEMPLMQPFIYLIEDGKKSVLYLHDTGRAWTTCLITCKKKTKQSTL